ncbi:MAG: PQQ-binding-like beta-propeller repeat protein, partial [Planctomycetota bacterium]
LSRESEQDDNRRLLWRYETQSKNPNGTRASIKTTATRIVFEDKQYQFYDGSSLPTGWLGPVSHNGVAVLTGGSLHCLDLKTGRPKWIRSGFKRNMVFGDEQVVYTSNPLTGKTAAFRLSDGSEAGQYKAPLGRYHWRPWGRNLIYYSGSHATGNELQLRMFDVQTQKDVWTLDLTAKFKAHFFSPDEFAIIQKDGTFGIYSAETGKPRFEAKVEIDPTFNPPHVMKGADDYIVALDHDDQPYHSKLQRAGVTVLMPSQGNPMPQRSGMTGMVYRFSMDGESLWKHPVDVNQFAFLSPIPYDSPVLVFLRFVQTRKKVNRVTYETKTQIVVVDRRTGQKVWEKERGERPQFTYIETNPLEQLATMTLPGIQRISFQVTDEPHDSSDDTQVVLERIPLPTPEKPKKAAPKK